MIATSQSLASAAGLRVLQNGGNAVDAAVTAAAVLAVIEPSMNGIGGDLFALVYHAATGTIHALDASGRSPAAATPEEFARRGLTVMPADGPLSVDVPGVVSGWDALLTRFGTISMAQALEPGIGYARDGFPVAELMAHEWQGAVARLSADAAATATFLPHGVAPGLGEMAANPRLAASLALVAEAGADAFYQGPIAQAIAADVQARNGLLAAQDFADHTVEWVEPIRANYRGYDVHELPPSTQGVVALEILNILEGFDITAMGHNSADHLHVLAEAKKIAFADRGAWLADRSCMDPRVLAQLLSKDYAARRRQDIDMTRAGRYRAGLAPAGPASSRDFAGRDLGDTIYLTAADGDGNVISFIQSLFASFGAGIVAGDTGITLSNRASGFVLTPGHPNQIGPRKRPLHTLVPAMVTKDGRPWLSFGVMGGDNQAQGHAQVVMNADRLRHARAGRRRGGAHAPHGRRAGARERHRRRGARGARSARAPAARWPRPHGRLSGHHDRRPTAACCCGGSDLRKDGLAIGW